MFCFWKRMFEDLFAPEKVITPPGIQGGPVPSLWIEWGRTGIWINVSHILCVAVTAELLTASCRHLKFYWEPERIGLSLKWYYRRVVLLVVLHFNFDETGTRGVNTPFPDLLYYWMTRSISRLGSIAFVLQSVRQKRATRRRGAFLQTSALFRLLLVAATVSDFFCKFFLETNVIL